MLYIIATPIGNLEDITLRALRVLKEVDFIIAEDTRKTKKILFHYRIPSKRILSFYDYNKEKRTPQILGLLKEGKTAAFVSSAGTPLISDPGYYLVKRCLKQGLPLTSLPGPSAVINALVLSGLPPDKFFFAGFVPVRSGQRKFFEMLSSVPATIIFFESPRRLCKTLLMIKDFFPQKTMAILKEMTKIYETRFLGDVEELITKICQNTSKIKGEITVVLDNR